MLLSARPLLPMSPDVLADRIVDLQVQAGAGAGGVAMHADPSFWLDGQGYRHVVPYFANLAVAALLDTDPSSRSLQVAEAWIDWYIERIGPEGVPVEHWVGIEEGLELTCPEGLPTQPAVPRCEAIDATDSAASTFLVVVDAYLRAGGSVAFLRQRERAIQEAARTLRSLQDADGLTLARTDYPVKFLMDNAETVAGFRAMARLEQEALGGDPIPFEEAARRATHGLTTLWNDTARLYAWAQMPDGIQEASLIDRWYADAVAQVWPLVFEVTADPGGYRQLDASWDGETLPDWTRHRDVSGFAWPVLGVAALRAGDRPAARRQAERLWRRHGAAAGEEPFTVADVGWLLRTVAALEDG